MAISDCVTSVRSTRVNGLKRGYAEVGLKRGYAEDGLMVYGLLKCWSTVTQARVKPMSSGNNGLVWIL